MIYPIPAFGMGPEMRIEKIEAVRDGVVYVGAEANGHFTPNGTGFLIWVTIDETYRVIFVVTAAHVIKGIAGDTVYVRLNRKSGDSASIPIHEKIIYGWEKNDITLIPLSVGADVYDFKFLNFNEAQINAARAVFEGISYGDEVYAVGLYTSHYGRTRNIPIVRIGHVALLPGEPVRGPGGYVEAYLIELRTIAGLSGSPVYLNPPPVRVKNNTIEHLSGRFYLPIGVLVGYHVVESKEDQVVVSKFQTNESDDDPQDTDSLDQRNTGFGVVIPIERVMDMIKGLMPTMKKAVKEVEAEKGKSGFRHASASASAPATDANPTHLEDFKSLLTAAAKTPPQDD